jgi:hypothetical protein
MLVIGLAAGIYLYLLVVGWGLASFGLPQGLRQYKLWLAPWLGIMLMTVLGVESSRLGIGGEIALYPITLAGAALSGWSILRKPQQNPLCTDLGWACGLAALITLFFALFPLLSLGQGLTTVSLGNNDTVYYAAIARFLEHGSLRHPPVCQFRQPLACLINADTVRSDRPGSYFLIGAFALLFHLQTFEIFTVLLAVALAVTPPLAGIFARVVSANGFAALLTLVIAAVNVNLLYFFYHGFAAQVLGQGCLMIAFILLWKSEAEDRTGFAYVPLLGLTLCALLEIYQEDVPLFVIPYFLYAGLQLLKSKTGRWRLIGRYALPGAIALALDPVAFRECIISLWELHAALVGWAMPRWALPADMLGFTNFHLPQAREYAVAIASVPVVFIAGWGVGRWRNRPLTFTVAAFALAFLLYLWGFQGFSYDYHKLVAILSFLLIAAFATGVSQGVRFVTPSGVRTIARAAVVAVAAGICVLAAAPLVAEMKSSGLVVSPDLIGLSEIKVVAGTRPISVVENRSWEQMWAVYFLYPAATLLANPSGYFHTRTYALTPEFPSALRLVAADSSLADSATGYFGIPPKEEASTATQITLVAFTPTSETVLWRNSRYLLLGSSVPEPDETPLPFLRVIGAHADGWISSQGFILDIPGDWARLRPNLKLSGSTNHRQLGANLAVRATLYMPYHPPQEVEARLESSPDRYTIWIKLNSTQLPAGRYFQVGIKFDGVTLAKADANHEEGSLVARAPQEITFSREFSQ